jgi:hypothetical protein
MVPCEASMAGSSLRNRLDAEEASPTGRAEALAGSA